MLLQKKNPASTSQRAFKLTFDLGYNFMNLLTSRIHQPVHLRSHVSIEPYPSLETNNRNHHPYKIKTHTIAMTAQAALLLDTY